MLSTPKTDFGFRLRVRLRNPLTSRQNAVVVYFKEQPVRISAIKEGQNLKEANWISLKASGFPTEEAARDFGCKLKLACEIAGVSTRVGIDSGQNNATSKIYGEFRRVIEKQHGITLRDNVHGLDVFKDDGTVRFFAVEATGTVSYSLPNFCRVLATIFDSDLDLSNQVWEAIVLLNYALMSEHPVASAVFAISSVEAASQRVSWNTEEKNLLKSVVSHIDASDYTSEAKQRVSNAVEKLLPRGVSQGVFELLEELGLEDYKPLWRSMYRERSKLVHGLAPLPGKNYDVFSRNAITLCVRIMAKLIERELPEFSLLLNERYPPEWLEFGESAKWKSAKAI